MKLILSSFLFAVILFSCNSEKEQPSLSPSKSKEEVITRYRAVDIKEINFKTSDDILIYGDLYESDKNDPLIVLFHQARGSARGEYQDIIPRLTKQGYNVLAIDQRSGGDAFKKPNRTVNNLENKQIGYCDAYPDLEAALVYARAMGFNSSIFVWGSSYSAALAINLGYQHMDKVAGVLAFSPASGGPMADCNPQKAIESIKVPLMILRPKKEMEVPSVAQQFELAKSKGHVTFIAENGVHGSSMLVESRTNSSTEPTWSAVFEFIENATH